MARDTYIKRANSSLQPRERQAPDLTVSERVHLLVAHILPDVSVRLENRHSGLGDSQPDD